MDNANGAWGDVSYFYSYKMKRKVTLILVYTYFMDIQTSNEHIQRDTNKKMDKWNIDTEW